MNYCNVSKIITGDGSYVMTITLQLRHEKLVEPPMAVSQSVGVYMYLPPSNKASAASMRNGDSLPANWYMIPPNGGPTERKRYRY